MRSAPGGRRRARPRRCGGGRRRRGVPAVVDPAVPERLCRSPVVGSRSRCVWVSCGVWSGGAGSVKLSSTEDHPYLVLQRAAQHHEAVVDQAVHERGVLVPSRLFLQRPGRIPFGAGTPKHHVERHAARLVHGRAARPGRCPRTALVSVSGAGWLAPFVGKALEPGVGQTGATSITPLHTPSERPSTGWWASGQCDEIVNAVLAVRPIGVDGERGARRGRVRR